MFKRSVLLSILLVPNTAFILQSPLRLLARRARSVPAFAVQILDDQKIPMTLDQKVTIAGLGGPSGVPIELAGHIQVEEQEGDLTTVTALRLGEDGSISIMATDGPLPKGFGGEWKSDGDRFWMVISRNFENDKTGTAYTVTHVLKGAIEERIGGGYTTICGEIVVGEDKVGFFEAIELPPDVDKPRESMKPKMF